MFRTAVGTLTVNRPAGTDHHAANLPLEPDQLLGEDGCPGHVDVRILPDLIHGLTRAGPGGKIEHRVDSPQGAFHGGRVTDIPGLDFRVLPDALQRRGSGQAFAVDLGIEAVEDADGAALFQQPVGSPAADEAGASED
jgi:hypothetical protein